MKEKLIELLMTFGLPVYLQGSMSEDEEYPSSFLRSITSKRRKAAFTAEDRPQ